MKKQALAIALVLCLLALVFSGCGKKNTSSDAAGSTVSQGSSCDSSTDTNSTASNDSTSSDLTSNTSNNQTGNEGQGGNNTPGVGDANEPDDPNEPTIPDVPDNSPTIYLEAEKKDDKVIVKVCARNNPGVATLNFRVDYDKTAVEPEKIEKGLVIVTSNLEQTTNLAGYITAVWVDVKGTTENGTLFTITFKPKSGATKATFSITADKNAFINPDVKPVEFKLKGTEIKF